MQQKAKFLRYVNEARKSLACTLFKSGGEGRRSVRMHKGEDGGIHYCYNYVSPDRLTALAGVCYNRICFRIGSE